MTPVEEALIKAGVAPDKAKQVEEVIKDVIKDVVINYETIDALRSRAVRRELWLLQFMIGMSVLSTLALIAVVTASAKYCI